MRFAFLLSCLTLLSSPAHGQICGELAALNRDPHGVVAYKMGEIDMLVRSSVTTDVLALKRTENIIKLGVPLSGPHLRHVFSGYLHSGKNVNFSNGGVWRPLGMPTYLTNVDEEALTPSQNYRILYLAYLASNPRASREGRYLERHNPDGSTNYFQAGIAGYVIKQCDAQLGLEGVSGKWSVEDDKICYITQNVDGQSCFSVYQIDHCYHYVSDAGLYDGYSFSGVPDINRAEVCEAHFKSDTD